MPIGFGVADHVCFQQSIVNLHEWSFIRNGLVNKQVQDLSGRPWFGACFCHGICGSCLGSKLGLLFILVDEMNEGVE